MESSIDSIREAAMTFSKLKKNKATAFALSFAGMVAFSSIASAEENIALPDNKITKELPADEFLTLAQAQETAAQKAARKTEERRLERERKKVEREKKRKERRKNRPKFGSFS